MSDETQIEEKVEDGYEDEKSEVEDICDENIQKIKDYVEKRKNSKGAELDRQKIRHLLIVHYNAEIERIIKDYVSDKGKVPEHLKRIKVTQEAHDKANVIAKQAVKLAESPIEIYIYALNPAIIVFVL